MKPSLEARSHITEDVILLILNYHNAHDISTNCHIFCNCFHQLKCHCCGTHKKFTSSQIGQKHEEKNIL